MAHSVANFASDPAGRITFPLSRSHSDARETTSPNHKRPVPQPQSILFHTSFVYAPSIPKFVTHTHRPPNSPAAFIFHSTAHPFTLPLTMPLKILLMGTGEFALPAFRAVLQSKHAVPLVVTQPDKTGRGHHQHVNVVRQLAHEFSVPVLQPQRINQPDVLDQLRQARADLFLVASYGQILRPALLAIPPLGAFNLHGSLLPKYRGAAPVQYSIWKGDSITGVTIFRIEPSLDSGPMAGRVETHIGPTETSGELMLRLATLCVPLTLEFLQQIESGTASFELQDTSQVVLSPKIQREDGRIDWSRSSHAIDCQIRAMQPWPKASTLLVRPDQPPVRCLLQQVRLLSADEQPAINAPPGKILSSDRRLFVRSGDGWLEVLSIQPEGKRPMEGTAFANGYSPGQNSEFHPG